GAVAVGRAPGLARVHAVGAGADLPRRTLGVGGAATADCRRERVDHAEERLRAAGAGVRARALLAIARIRGAAARPVAGRDGNGPGDHLEHEARAGAVER